MDGFRFYTCLKSQVICSTSPKSIIYVLFVTEAETFKALPLFPVLVEADTSATIFSESTFASANEVRVVLFSCLSWSNQFGEVQVHTAIPKQSFVSLPFVQYLLCTNK